MLPVMQWFIGMVSLQLSVTVGQVERVRRHVRVLKGCQIFRIPEIYFSRWRTKFECQGLQDLFSSVIYQVTEMLKMLSLFFKMRSYHAQLTFNCALSRKILTKG